MEWLTKRDLVRKMYIQKWLMQWQRKKIFVKHRQKKDSCEECTQWQQRTINIKGQRKCRVLLIKIKNSLGNTPGKEV